MLVSNKLIWFRQDLRVADNTALAAACEDAGAVIYGLFIATPGQWRQHDMAPKRERFVRRHVAALKDSLTRLQIPLLYLETELFDTVPDMLADLVNRYDFSDVYANYEYAWNEKQRDIAVRRALSKVDCGFHLYHDQSMLAPGLRTKSGKPYSIFTPYKKCWLEKWRATRPFLYNTPKRRERPADIASMAIPLLDPAEEEGCWPTGEDAAGLKLTEFCRHAIEDYKVQRDIPALDGTSNLSPWLSAGVISPRQCLEAASAANNGRLSGGLAGIDTWISELIWRDFYIHILDSFPEVSKNRPFRKGTENIAWCNDESNFQAWCIGLTGIPIVDAAMRQLTQTGWMHNRLRMITAMFLSKHLLIDWRRGERFFMQHLIDGHLASNNGGWQWAASTGTDAVPYFRIFNPVTQSQRFDSKGDFIRRYVPELARIEGKAIHMPSEYDRATYAADYPAPIVNLKRARATALLEFSHATARTE